MGISEIENRHNRKINKIKNVVFKKNNTDKPFYDLLQKKRGEGKKHKLFI